MELEEDHPSPRSIEFTLVRADALALDTLLACIEGVLKGGQHGAPDPGVCHDDSRIKGSDAVMSHAPKQGAEALEY